MNRLLFTWILVVLTSQLTSAIILRPKWFPYFSRHNQGGSGRVGGGGGGSSHIYHQSGRPAGTLASRQARTVGIVDMEPDFTASQHVPAYLHSLIRSGTKAGGINGYNNNYFFTGRDGRSNFGHSSISEDNNNNIPRCRSGQKSTDCLNRVLMLVEEMLELEKNRRAAFTDSFYD